MSNDRPNNYHEGRAQAHSFARGEAASCWGRPDGGHVGQPGSHVGQPAPDGHVGRPGNANHVGTPAFDEGAHANAAIQQGLQNCGDIYRSSLNQVGSPAPEPAGPGGPGRQFDDAPSGFANRASAAEGKENPGAMYYLRQAAEFFGVPI